QAAHRTILVKFVAASVKKKHVVNRKPLLPALQSSTQRLLPLKQNRHSLHRQPRKRPKKRQLSIQQLNRNMKPRKKTSLNPSSNPGP
ncbi:hypothetical protein, partial [Pseudomonas viridiflava]|uniref:hypothetical protein n=1 Tax=Pseudomonas viridiflava TaxID=33069 RepID=UPI001BAFA379